MFFPQKTSKAKASHVVMSLFILGELGRFMYVILYNKALCELILAIVICHLNETYLPMLSSTLVMDKRRFVPRPPLLQVCTLSSIMATDADQTIR